MTPEWLLSCTRLGMAALCHCRTSEPICYLTSRTGPWSQSWHLQGLGTEAGAGLNPPSEARPLVTLLPSVAEPQQVPVTAGIPAGLGIPPVPLGWVSSAEQGASLPATLAMWVQCRGLLTKCRGAHARGRYCCVIPSLHLWEGYGRGGALCSVVRLSGAQVDGLDLESGSRHFTHIRAAVRQDSSAQNGWEPPRSPMPLAPVCGHIGSLLRLRLRSCPSAFSGSWAGWRLCQVGWVEQGSGGRWAEHRFSRQVAILSLS